MPSPLLVSTAVGPSALRLGVVGRRGAHGSSCVHRVALQTEVQICCGDFGQAALGLTLFLGGGLRSFAGRV